MTTNFFKAGIAVCLGLALSACGLVGQDGEILSGDREPIRAEDGFTGVVPALVSGSDDIRLPRERNTASWTHSGSDASHAQPHSTLGQSLTQAWSTQIGQGQTRKHRITATPVADRGRIFTMDSVGLVSALNAEGAILWQVDLSPARDGADASGGGLAVDGETLYATTAFGRLFAIDASSGDIAWQQNLDAAGSAPPAVAGGIVYVVGGDSRAWAIDAGTGRINWTLSGVPSVQSLTGGGAPAIGRSLAIFPFANGDVEAVFRRGGFNRWTAAVSGGREGFAVSTVTEIASDPVISNGRVYVGNFSGRLAAFNATTGSRIWTAQNGALGSIVPVGSNDLFTISDQNQLMRLSARNGETIWSKQLPHFLDERENRRSEVVEHYGPLFAGGRLLVASSDGLVRQFNLQDGAELGSISITGGAASDPIVVDGTMYIVNANGQLIAFR